MLKPYWPYIVEKNWKYSLSEEAKHSNIFCYGRPGSDRTEKVAVPVAETAIEEFRSCVIYAETATAEYAGIRQLAIRQGYDIYDLEDTAIAGEDRKSLAEEIAYNITEGKPTLVLISDADFKLPAHVSIVHDILSCVFKKGEQRFIDNFSPNYREDATLFVLDDLCGNTVLGSYLLKPTFLQFCIIMGSEIASQYWREKAIATTLESPAIPKTVIDQVDGNSFVEIIQRFFLNIETVICTGVNGIIPKEHRNFIGKCIFGDHTARLGGRYIIEERPDPEKLRTAKNLQKIQKVEIDQNNIESSTYNDIAVKSIRAGDWICEIHGRVWLFFDGGSYQPLTFPSKHDAINWVESDMRRHPDFEFLRKEDQKDIIRYIFNFDGGEDDYKIIRIGAEEVENYRLAYLLRVLDMAELDDVAKWLATEEAAAQGYDPQDGLQANMTKYFDNLRQTENNMDKPEEQADEQEFSVIPDIDPYWKKYQEKQPNKDVVAQLLSLPEEGVLFLGGHINMVKRIRKLHPGWIFITDDQFRPHSAINVKYVFYWTNHSSHKMMENVFAKLAPDAEIMYVTATNMERLDAEMLSLYLGVQTRKRRS